MLVDKGVLVAVVDGDGDVDGGEVVLWRVAPVVRLKVALLAVVPLPDS